MKRILTRAAMCGLLLASLTACGARAPEGVEVTRRAGLDTGLLSQAIRVATRMDAQGQRVWCVPFARNATGIEIKGDAGTWWDQAKAPYVRSHTPAVGAIMAFSASSKLSRGHLAVVSRRISDREITIHHANWHPNKVSLDMGVIDVSDAGDWSKVRVESQPGVYGSTYPVDGFILQPRG